MKKSQLNETQPIINEILSKLKAKHTHANVHIYGDVVDFYYGQHLQSIVEISYIELHEALLNKTIPNKITKLL
jgi:hypothetical protein